MIPAWAVMWGLSAGIFAGVKALSLWRPPPGSLGRKLAYVVGWPGLDAAAFLTKPAKTVPSRNEWLFAAAKTALGTAIIWLLSPRAENDYVRGWVGMTGVVFVLHFGLFHLLSCFWRSRGIDAKPLMHWPVAAKSLSDFWGRRWNTAFRDVTHRFVFAPLTPRIGATAALGVGFLLSGLVHDLVITLPAGGGYGMPTAYFLLQAVGLLLERKLRLRGVVARLFAAVVLLGPAPLLFPMDFVRNVILPFLTALGAAPWNPPT